MIRNDNICRLGGIYMFWGKP